MQPSPPSLHISLMRKSPLVRVILGGPFPAIRDLVQLTGKLFATFRASYSVFVPPNVRREIRAAKIVQGLPSWSSPSSSRRSARPPHSTGEPGPDPHNFGPIFETTQLTAWLMKFASGTFSVGSSCRPLNSNETSPHLPRYTRMSCLEAKRLRLSRQFADRQ